MTNTQTIPAIDYIAWGPRNAMIAEVSTPDYYEGRYLVQIIGKDTWDAEGFSTLRTAKAHAKYLAKTYNVRVASFS